MTNHKKTKAKTQAKTQAPPDDTNAPLNPHNLDANMFGDLLSMTGYFSIVGVHTTLWIFVAFYLPRTAVLSDLAKPQWGEAQISSRDRPQHPFLEPLTSNPTATLIYICAGAVMLQSWWGGWMREWWLQLGIEGTEEEKRTEKAFHDRQKMTVRDLPSLL
jgi:phosphatidylinositol glycan class F